MINFKNTTNQIDFLYEKTGSQIYFGPFSGLKIPPELKPELTVAEILGFYESCLFDVWGRLAGRKTDHIMMIGGSHGYYSAGLSYLLQPEQNHVFETNFDSHFHIKQWTVHNNILMPNLYGTATEEIMADWKLPIDVIICDCEGGELSLINPQKFPWQKSCDLLVEVHPFYGENLLGTLIKRFKKTHKITIIYDDFSEDQKIMQALTGFGLEKLKYDNHPSHRWINKNGKKVYTSGVFLYLEQ